MWQVLLFSNTPTHTHTHTCALLPWPAAFCQGGENNGTFRATFGESYAGLGPGSSMTLWLGCPANGVLLRSQVADCDGTVGSGQITCRGYRVVSAW